MAQQHTDPYRKDDMQLARPVFLFTSSTKSRKAAYRHPDLATRKGKTIP